MNFYISFNIKSSYVAKKHTDQQRQLIMETKHYEIHTLMRA